MRQKLGERVFRPKKKKESTTTKKNKIPGSDVRGVVVNWGLNHGIVGK